MTDAAPSSQNVSSKWLRKFSDLVIPSGFAIRASSFISCSKEKYSGEDRVRDEHREQRLDDGRGGGLSNTFRAAFDVQSGVACDRDHDPGKDHTFDHS